MPATLYESETRPYSWRFRTHGLPRTSVPVIRIRDTVAENASQQRSWLTIPMNLMDDRCRDPPHPFALSRACPELVEGLKGPPSHYIDCEPVDLISANVLLEGQLAGLAQRSLSEVIN